MPDVSSTAPAEVTTWVALDVHKHSIVAATLPASGGEPRLRQIETTERAIRRFARDLGDPATIALCYEAGPCGYGLLRLLAGMGLACDVVAPSLVPVQAGARVKTDRRDAKRLVTLYRAGALTFVAPPSLEQEGLRDLVRARDDLRQARTAARHRVAKSLLRYGHVFREGKRSWTKAHMAWVRRQRLQDPLAQEALSHLLCHLDALDAQLAALDHRIDEVAATEPWSDPVRWLCAFRGISTRTALGLLAEIGDFRRFASPRELMGFLGLTPSEYSSGESRHRGHITKTGNEHARRLLVEAAWHYRHPPRTSDRARAHAAHVPPEVPARAWAAQVRLHHRYRHLTAHGKRSPVANVAVARELCGFLWAAMTDQPLREEVAA
ncbi:MAG: IS110 family transposase [Actinobacteria bacterium]|nr:IS110 family transposase [Actinomycetota bacterium]